MARSFTYTSLPTRVVFGTPVVPAVDREVVRLGLRRVLLVTSPGQRAAAQTEPIRRALGEHVAGAFTDAREHVPADVLAACLAAHATATADGIVAIGGGSAIGLGKLVAAATRTPVIAVPTTYSGAEMTPFNAVTENGVKVQRRDPAMLPAAIVYDPELTLTLPMSISGPSMMNALAHAVEGLYAPETNPVVAMKAEAAIRLAARALPVLSALGDDHEAKDLLDARADLLLSAMLSGEVLAVTSVALHHKLCHILGGGYGLPHAATNAVILPYAVAYNAAGAPEAMISVAGAMEVPASDVAGAIFDLARTSAAAPSLAALGLPLSALDAIARTAAGQAYANPVPLEQQRLRDMLDDAWNGRRPASLAVA